MDHEYERTEISRSLMAGLFAGLGCVLAILIFNFIYRDVTGFESSGLVNVSSISFSTLIMFMVAGVIFDGFHHYLKHGTAVFIVLAIIATLVAVFLSLTINNKGYEGIILGIIIIAGIFTAFVLPKLYSSNAI